MVYDTKTGDLDPKFFSTWLKKMDDDVAAAFVLSGLALDPQKILDAFDTACEVMHLRALEKQKKGQPGKDGFDLSSSEDTKDFFKKIDDLLASTLGTKKKDSDTEK